MALFGLSQLQQKLKRIPQAVRKSATESVVVGAQEIASMQQRLAPVDSGELRKSIHITMPGGTTPPYSTSGGKRKSRKPLKAGPHQAIITAGNTDVRYAHIVEFGSPPHLAGGFFKGMDVMHPGTPAQPFFWPGYRALRKRTKRRISTNIKKAIVAKAKTP
jgi:HK97 gp10 family phage protein